MINHIKNKNYLLKLLLLLTNHWCSHRMLFLIMALIVAGCGQSTSKPSLIVNEEPLIYLYPLDADKPEPRQTQLNIHSLAGLKLADSPLQLTFKEGELGTQILLNNDDNELFSDLLYKANINGLCIDKHSNSIAIFIGHVYEGIGLQQEDLLHKNTQGQWQLSRLVFDEYVPNVEKYSQCDMDGATPHWEEIATQPSFKLCECNLPLLPN